MPDKKIPCKDCANETKKIEELGNAKVISCNPIPSEPGWCRIIWKYTDN